MNILLPKIRKFGPFLLLVLLLVLAPDSARADSVLSVAAFGIAWIISSIAAIAIALEAWLLGFILNINMEIVSSAPVKFGFPVALSLANLGFVLAIIIIAIATIIRNQTYNVKQILWKLIVMAILVNFGLVIAGSILTFTDSLSLYFLSGVDPGGSVGGATSGRDSVINFASAVGGAFAPQKLISIDPDKLQTPDVSFVDKLRAVINYATGNLSGLIGAEFLSPLATIIFTVFFQLLIIITLGTLIAMLLVRYVYLGFLLVLLPLAWVSWIFPTFDNNFQKWWQHFLRQAFFAPIVLFFLWLAMQTSLQMSNAGPQFFEPYISDSNIVWAGISQVFTNILKPFISQILQLTVVLGVMLGGIFIAHGMGIKFADAAQKAAYGVGNSFGGYVGRKAKSAGTSVFDRARTTGRAYNPATRETTTTLQRLGSRLQGIPGIRGLGAVIAGQGTAVPKARADEIEKFRKSELESLNHEGIIARATSRTALLNPTTAAAVGQELARRNLTGDPRVAPVMNQFVETSERMGNAQTIYNNDPRLAQPRRNANGVVVETRDEAIERVTRNIKVADTAQLDHRALGDHAGGPASHEQALITLNLSNPQLSKLGSEGSFEQQEAVRNTVREFWLPIQGALEAAARAQGATPANLTHDQLTQYASLLTPAEQAQYNRISRAVRHVNTSPNWQNI